MIRVCSAFPSAEEAEAFAAAFRLLWPAAVDLATETCPPEELERAQVSMPGAQSADLGDGDIVAWLDPDIETVSSVPSFVVPHLLKEADLCFIGTSSADADFGFWAVRLSAATRAFLRKVADRARAGGDPAAIWAAELKAAELNARDLTPGGSGELWSAGPLGRYTRRGPAR